MFCAPPLDTRAFWFFLPCMWKKHEDTKNTKSTRRSRWDRFEDGEKTCVRQGSCFANSWGVANRSRVTLGGGAGCAFIAGRKLLPRCFLEWTRLVRGREAGGGASGTCVPRQSLGTRAQAVHCAALMHPTATASVRAGETPTPPTKRRLVRRRVLLVGCGGRWRRR
jgi:hypothetical protein